MKSLNLRQGLNASFGARVGLMVLCAGLMVCLNATKSWSQTDLATLNGQLQQAVTASQWDQALQVVNQMIASFPSQRPHLEAYRSQLLQLQSKSLPVQNVPSGSSQAAFPRGTVPIKRRSNGVIIVDAKFNDRKVFEVMVDSGASLTVITRPMAQQLGINQAEHIIETVTFKTANGVADFPIVYLRSIEVGGLVTRQLPVAIGGPDLEMGLLGQDFLQHYDVSIKRDRIEFHTRN